MAEECRAAREGCAFFDTSYFGKLQLEGARADEAMQWLCAADLEGKTDGSVTYTPLCNVRAHPLPPSLPQPPTFAASAPPQVHGGVEADLTVTKVADNSWCVLFPTSRGLGTAAQPTAGPLPSPTPHNALVHTSTHSFTPPPTRSHLDSSLAGTS